MNSSFLRVDLSRWQRRWHRGLAHPLGRPFLLALGLNALLLVGAALTPASRPFRSLSADPATPTASLDDAPQLLRFGRRLQAAQARLDAQAGTAAAGPLPPLSVASLAALDALPPPPPDLLPETRKPSPGKGKPAPSPTLTPAAEAPATANPLPADGGEGLPAEPAEVLELARGWIPGASASAIDSFSEAAQAVRRRLLWPDTPLGSRLQALWKRARPVSSPPFTGLGAEAEVRRLSSGAAADLGLARPQGLTLVERDGLLLLWRDGDGLWLIRTPLRAGSRESAAASP